MHRSKIELHNIDCLPFMKQCKDKQFDLAIVDPPYRDEKDNAPTKQMRAKLDGKMKNFGNKPTSEFWTQLFRISKNQIVWGANNFIENLNNTNCFVFWDKLVECKNYSDGELAWTSFNKPAKMVRYVWSGNRYGTPNNIQGVGKPTCRIHPTEKPIYLYEWLLAEFAEKGNKIFDPYLGSGSIAVACDNLKYDLVATEINSNYFDKANERLKQHRKQQTLF